MSAGVAVVGGIRVVVAANCAAHPSRVIDQSPNSRLTGTNTAAGGARRSWLTRPPFIQTIHMNDHSARRSSRRSITGLHWKKKKGERCTIRSLTPPELVYGRSFASSLFAAIIADYLAEKRNFAGSFKDVQTKTLFSTETGCFCNTGK